MRYRRANRRTQFCPGPSEWLTNRGNVRRRRRQQPVLGGAVAPYRHAGTRGAADADAGTRRSRRQDRRQAGAVVELLAAGRGVSDGAVSCCGAAHGPVTSAFGGTTRVASLPAVPTQSRMTPNRSSTLSFNSNPLSAARAILRPGSLLTGRASRVWPAGFRAGFRADTGLIQGRRRPTFLKEVWNQAL